MGFLAIALVLAGCGDKGPDTLKGFKTVTLGHATFKVDPKWDATTFAARPDRPLYSGGDPLVDAHNLYAMPRGKVEFFAGRTSLTDANRWLQQASALVSNRRRLVNLRYQTRTHVRDMSGAKTTAAQAFEYRDGAAKHCVQEELGLRGRNYLLVRADTRGGCRRGWDDFDDVIKGVHIKN